MIDNPEFAVPDASVPTPTVEVSSIIESVPLITEKTDRLVWRLFGTAAAALIVVAALTVALFAEHTSQSTAQCVNHVLFARSASTDTERSAQDALLAAQSTENDAFSAALRESATSPARVIPDIQAALTTYHDASARYQVARARDNAARKAHPLGKC